MNKTLIGILLSLIFCIQSAFAQAPEYGIYQLHSIQEQLFRQAHYTEQMYGKGKRYSVHHLPNQKALQYSLKHPLLAENTARRQLKIFFQRDLSSLEKSFYTYAKLQIATGWLGKRRTLDALGETATGNTRISF